MSDIAELQAQARTDVGKGASRRLRREADLIPAIIYGGESEPQKITLKHNKIIKALENEAFYSSILTVDIDGKKQKTVLKAIQRHPSRPRILHMDFLRITGKEAIIMKVPLHFKGEDVAPGVKEGGVINHLITDLEIKCLPKDLPEFIEVDLSQLEIGHSVHMSDLKLPNGVELAGAEIDAEHDVPVASVHQPRAAIEEEEVAAPEEAEEEAPAESESKPEDENKEE